MPGRLLGFLQPCSNSFLGTEGMAHRVGGAPMAEDVGTQRVQPFLDELGWPPSPSAVIGSGGPEKAHWKTKLTWQGTRPREPVTLISQEHRKGFKVHRGFSGVFVFHSESAQVGLWLPDYAYIHTFSWPICSSECTCCFRFMIIYKPGPSFLLT